MITNDLDYIFDSIHTQIGELKNKSIFITGGTGFFGEWIVRSLLYFNEKLDLNIKIGLLTRSINRYILNHSNLYWDNPNIDLFQGDISNFKFPEKKYDYIIHGASTSSIEKFNGAESISRFLILSDGTKHLLDYAVNCNVEKFLLISSGSVYGKQNVKKIDESYNCSLSTTDVNSCYGEGKRIAELLCSMYAQRYNFELKIMRCFSFVGPYMPLDIHFAIGNFIKDAVYNKKITIKGDGNQIRSYMYMSDFIIWLWTIFFNGKSNTVYNVGSDEAISMKDLALKIVGMLNNVSLEILDQVGICDTVDRYVPSIERAKKDLNLGITLDLSLALEKTISFVKRNV